MTTQTDLQAALERYQAATETTRQRTQAWEDSKATEIAARLAMNNSTREEETAAKALLDLVAEMGETSNPPAPPAEQPAPPPPPPGLKPAPEPAAP